VQVLGFDGRGKLKSLRFWVGRRLQILLIVPRRGIEAIKLEKFIVRSLFNDSAPVNYIDEIRSAGDRETVRYYHAAAPANDTSKTIEPIRFRPRVHKTGWFVQYYYLGLSKVSPSESDSLPLTTA
jgi:hypothetical protein